MGMALPEKRVISPWVPFMKKANQEKGAPSDIKKGIQKDASVLGQIAFEVLRLSKGHPAEIAFLPNPRRVAAYRIYVRRQGLSK